MIVIILFAFMCIIRLVWEYSVNMNSAFIRPESRYKVNSLPTRAEIISKHRANRLKELGI